MDQLGRGINKKIHGLLLLLVRWGGLRNLAKRKKERGAPQQHPWPFFPSGERRAAAPCACAGLFAGEGRAALPPPGISSFLLFENEHSNPNASCLYLDLWNN